MSDSSAIFPSGEIVVRQWGSVSAGGLKAEAHSWAAIQKLRAEFADLMAKGGLVTTNRALMEGIHGRKFTKAHMGQLMAIGAEASHFPDAGNESAIYTREGFPTQFCYLHPPIKFRQLPSDKRNWTSAFVRDEAAKSLILNHFSGNVEFQGEALESNGSQATASHFPASHFPITPLSWREYQAANIDLSERQAKAAVAALKANPPAGARKLAVSFEGGRGSATPYLVNGDMTNAEAVAAIEAATDKRVKMIFTH